MQAHYGGLRAKSLQNAGQNWRRCTRLCVQGHRLAAERAGGHQEGGIEKQIRQYFTEHTARDQDPAAVQLGICEFQSNVMLLFFIHLLY